jgi:hypothetical protein
MRVLLAGSRSFQDYAVFRRHVLAILPDPLPTDVEVISGKATGADTLGEMFADEFGFPVIAFPADWKNVDVPGAVIRYHADGTPFNKNAGPCRNQRMLDEGRPDIVIVFTRGGPGSSDMISRASKAGVPLHVIDLRGRKTQKPLF